MNKNEIFTKLKSYFKEYESSLIVVHDESDNYYLNTKTIGANKKANFFGAIQIKKSYISYHLMPVYYHPELLEDVSEALKNKMQGKSCFNFKDFDEAIFEELNALTKSCFSKYKSLNMI